MEELKSWLQDNLRYWNKESSIKSSYIKEVLNKTLNQIKKIEEKNKKTIDKLK